MTFAAVGDSITAWIDRGGVHNHLTWVSFAESPDLHFIENEGWAAGGAKLAEMQANVRPITADVLIIAAGTNDLGDKWGTPIGERLASIDMIVAISDPPKVVLAAVPPLDSHPAWAIEWNTVLQQFAEQRGWSFIDPWADVRSPDGQYLPGLTIDGIHPTLDAQQIAADAIAKSLTAR